MSVKWGFPVQIYWRLDTMEVIGTLKMAIANGNTVTTADKDNFGINSFSDFNASQLHYHFMKRRKEGT